jgi:hypothetical protein
VYTNTRDWSRSYLEACITSPTSLLSSETASSYPPERSWSFYMVTDIDKMGELVDALNIFNGHISSLADAWAMGSDEAYEYSEPFFIGGAASTTGNLYSCRAPFQGPCQFMVDFATAGSTATHIIVSSFPKRASVDFTGNIITSYQDSQMDALVIFAPQNQTVPISTSWYSVRNSENTVYVTVVANNNAAGVNIQFRQKRKLR